MTGRETGHVEGIVLLQFETTESIGRVFVSDQDEGESRWGELTRWEPLAEARWDVLIPDGYSARLLAYESIGDDDLDIIVPMRPEALRDVVLMNCAISDDAVSSLTSLTHLRLLDLFRTNVTDQALVDVADLESLEWLSLTGTTVTDDGVALISGLPELRRLSLRGTHVTTGVGRHVAELEKLEWLSLAHTGVTDAVVKHLVGMASLAVVDIEGTRITPVGRHDLVGHGVTIIGPSRAA